MPAEGAQGQPIMEVAIYSEASASAFGAWQSDISSSVALAQCWNCWVNEAECLWEDILLTCLCPLSCLQLSVGERAALLWERLCGTAAPSRRPSAFLPHSLLEGLQIGHSALLS